MITEKEYLEAKKIVDAYNEQLRIADIMRSKRLKEEQLKREQECNVNEYPPHDGIPLLGYDEYGNSFHVIRDVDKGDGVIEFLSAISYTPIKFRIVKYSYLK